MDEVEQLDSVAGLARDLEPGLGQDARGSVPEQHRVVSEDHTHGMSARSRTRPAGSGRA